MQPIETRMLEAEALWRRGDALVDGVCRDGTPYRAEAMISLAEGEQERLYTVLLRPVPVRAGDAYFASITSEAVRKASTAAGKPQ